MSLHYLDPDRELRECPKCSKLRNISTMSFAERRRYQAVADQCPGCGGTGRLGMEGAEPDVNVFTWGGTLDADRGWYYAQWPPLSDPTGETISPTFGPFPTEAAALAAARKEHKS